MDLASNRPLLNAIEREFTQIGYRWAIFCQLFDSGEANVELLNRSGSNVFQLLQKLIIDDVMASQCRLADPARSMGHENASIRNLVEKLDGHLSATSKAEIHRHLGELDQHLHKIKVLRNKAISHADLTHALKPELLPRPTYIELEGAIDAVRYILEEITGHLFNYSSDYIPHLPFGSDGNKLLQVLAQAHGQKQD